MGEAIEGRSGRRYPHPREPIGDYLSDDFLGCRSGLRDMYYDAIRKILIVPTSAGARHISMRVKRRVRIDVAHESQIDRVEARDRE
jgi:hypothetical protein